MVLKLWIIYIPMPTRVHNQIALGMTQTVACICMSVPSNICLDHIVTVCTCSHCGACECALQLCNVHACSCSRSGCAFFLCSCHVALVHIACSAPEGLSGMVAIAWWSWCRFIHFPSASAEQAIALGRKAAAVVSARFPAAMELKFEAVCCPFLLLHVNRPAPPGGLLLSRALSKIVMPAGPLSLLSTIKTRACEHSPCPAMPLGPRAGRLMQEAEFWDRLNRMYGWQIMWHTLCAAP